MLSHQVPRLRQDHLGRLRQAHRRRPRRYPAGPVVPRPRRQPGPEPNRAGWDDMQDGALKAWDALTDLGAKLGVTSSAFQNRDDANASSFSSLQLD
ncbi:hypothetical protein IU427_31745 [Nocardia beijingensis]|uniref:hypothetical protein n=1 Tax=Nocardia beijingensis TaxID=95162 RepID=UPI0018960EF5|nr:hypothetical protein [Nocardia beijingensis]MBF6469706.1 hypothetical protein [Nocardia beijingensis]